MNYKSIQFMRQGFFRGVKNLFSSKNNTVQPQTPQREEPPRVISFGEDKKNIVEQKDTRYDGIESKQSWKELGIRRDEAMDGEVPLLVDSNFVRLRTVYGHYQQVLFVLSDYQIFIKNNNGLTHFPLGKIEKLHKYTNNEGHYKLLIGLKDGRVFKLRINTEPMWKKIYDFIQKFAFVRVKNHFFAFKHFQANKEIEETYKGWQLWNMMDEYKRMGVKLMPHSEDPVNQYYSDYKILDNKDGRVCSTYPQKIIVPSRIPYDYLVRCSKFRSRSRMPALTYLYRSQTGMVGLWRSSQSKVGVSNSRSPQDQMVLRLIGNPSLDYKDQQFQPVNCVIYDARNKMAAIGNKVAGKGYQYEEYYQNCKVQFLNIPNIHAVRQSYQKAQRAALGQDSKFYTGLAESEWYDYVFIILQGALSVAKSLLQGKNVLVHCSDGWDRTSQLCALAGIILDPYYRTIQGFQVLVQKDWIRFGHQFGVRMGQGVNNPNSQEKSPIFLQFLDCVSQLMYQYPTDFQFNFRYLQQMADLAQSNLYGTFLCNCELQMRGLGIQQKTVSLWSYFLKNRQNFTSPFFAIGHQILQPSCAQKHFRFWKEHFLQYVPQFQDIYDIYSCKFTEDNLEIMYKHINQQKNLLQQKIAENKTILEQINRQIAQLNDQETA